MTENRRSFGADVGRALKRRVAKETRGDLSDMSPVYAHSSAGLGASD